MRRLPILLGGATVLSCLCGSQGGWAMNPSPRMQVDQRGDFLLIGNTLGYPCGVQDVIAPGGGSLSSGSACSDQVAWDDPSPDLFWRADDTGAAVADPACLPAQARTTAVLTIPAGATVTRAYLYWAANGNGSVGTEVTLDRPGAGAFQQTVTAQDTYGPASKVVYESVADITALVQQHGTGAYRVGGVKVAPFVDVQAQDLFGAWAIVVFYQKPDDPIRTLALYDGMDPVSVGIAQDVTLRGFVLPATNPEGKLGVLAYLGDADMNGVDQLLFRGTALTDNTLNPANNFFNSTRSRLGVSATAPGDAPLLTGTFGSMGGVDLDIVDISTLLGGRPAEALVSATSTNDKFYLGALVTSVGTLKPDFATSTKTVSKVVPGQDAGAAGSSSSAVWGDVLEYTIAVKNTGNDASASTVLTDSLPAEVTYVPGSLRIVMDSATATLTDAVDSDRGEFLAADDAGPRRVVVRIGQGADGTVGGSIPAQGTVVVSFRVTVNAGVTGSISNQALITAKGASGAAEASSPTDGNGDAEGAPATQVTVNQCDSNANCSAPTPTCDTTVSPKVCVGCLVDSDCGAAAGRVCTTAHTCIPGCRLAGGGSGCAQGQSCTPGDAAEIGQCTADLDASMDASDGGASDAGDGSPVDAASDVTGTDAGDGGVRDAMADVVADQTVPDVAADAAHDATTADASLEPIDYLPIDTSGIIAQGNGISCDCTLMPRSAHRRGAVSLFGLALAACVAALRRRPPRSESERDHRAHP